jgi:hypothetical protein
MIGRAASFSRPDDVGRPQTVHLRHMDVTLVFEVGAEGTEQRLLQLSEPNCEADRKAIQLEAHSLKSDAATFGWRDLSRAAAILEKEAPELQDGRYRSLRTELSQLYRTQTRNWRFIWRGKPSARMLRLEARRG